MSRKDIEYEKIGKSCSGTAQTNISYFILTICFRPILTFHCELSTILANVLSVPGPKKIKFNIKLQFDN